MTELVRALGFSQVALTRSYFSSDPIISRQLIDR